jgi:hypothetical protein
MQSRLTAFCYVRISRSGFCATVETCDQELRKIEAETRRRTSVREPKRSGTLVARGGQRKSKLIADPRKTNC